MLLLLSLFLLCLQVYCFGLLNEMLRKTYLGQVNQASIRLGQPAAKDRCDRDRQV